MFAPLALGGCGLWDSWFGDKKTPIPGKREPVQAGSQGLRVDEGVGKVVLPQAVQNAGWPQAGGNPAHLMGHLATGVQLSEAWSAGIGAGGGYRRKIMAQPVAANGIVYVMDSEAVVSAFDIAGGARVWRFDTKNDEDDSTNIGGGIAIDQGTLYAVNGLSELVALDAAKGTVRWRSNFGAPARSAPTVVEGRLFLVTIEDRLVALTTENGRQLWQYQASNPTTSVLGSAAPAFSDGLVGAGLCTGELAALRADRGNVAWTDNLASAQVSSLTNFPAVRGLPVIGGGRVYAIGMGGLMVADDLPTGRRLWERSVSGEDNPWAAGDWLFIVSLDQKIAAISRDEGRVAWVTQLPQWENPEKQRRAITWWGPLLVGDRLVVAGTSEQALAISPYTGDILGQQDLSGKASLGPIAAAGTVFVVTDDARLLALR